MCRTLVALGVQDHRTNLLWKLGSSDLPHDLDGLLEIPLGVDFGHDTDLVDSKTGTSFAP